MQRVRIGITGLAVVFLIVLLAAAIVGFRSNDRSDDGNVIAESENSAKAPSDPLADLGVAPGGPPSESNAPPAAPPQR